MTANPCSLAISLILLPAGAYLAEATAQTQPLPKPLLTPPRVLAPPPTITGLPGGPCGVHPPNDPNFVPIGVDAKATSPFEIVLTVGGPVGTYTIQSAGLASTVSIAQPLRVAPNMKAPQQTGTFTHMPAFPGTRYDYVVRADLGAGRTACGQASATTLPAPPLANVSSQYLDVSHVSLGFMVPPFAHEAHLYRGGSANAANKAADIAVQGRNFAGKQGQLVPSIVVDPGPPPFPYDGTGHYRRAPASYAFALEVIWTANPDGSGNHISVTYPIAAAGPTPIVGYADLHSHQMAYLGFGGNPQNYPLGHYFWGKAYGPLPSAVPWCTPVCGPGGTGDLANYLMQKAQYGYLPANTGHAVGGFVEFDGYPRWNSFTGQAYHEDWLYRAHLGGLNLIVVHPVNNAWMCTMLNHVSTGGLIVAIATGPIGLGILGGEIAKYADRTDPDCDDDTQARNQINEIWAMQNDIDNRVGDGKGHVGPGTGWYRVVQSPQETRNVIAAGKLAVVIGMEIDNPFNCSNVAANMHLPNCTDASLMALNLDSYYKMGVRHLFPIHFYNNAFGGSANSNALITYSFTNNFRKRNCSSEQYEYDTAQCNADGLSSVGKSFISQLMKRGMIIDVDHMSALSFNDTLAIVTPTMYPVVASHAGFQAINKGDENNEGQRTDSQIARMRQVGGMLAVIPHQGHRAEIIQYPPGSNIPHSCGNSSQSVVQAYRYAVHASAGGPVAFGTDLNGFAGWPSPRFGPEACMGDRDSLYETMLRNPLTYPFTIRASGVNISSRALGPSPSTFPSINAVGQSVVGQKTFDFNVDGFAQIGLLPDMIADWESMGMQPAELDPLFFSTEGYVRLWERATYLSSHNNY
jgi:microsomal dipeptidase-like Zn-dependent dipeptidase